MTSAISWKAAIWAGIIAGAVFMMLEMVLVGTVGGQSPWGPPRMIRPKGLADRRCVIRRLRCQVLA